MSTFLSTRLEALSQFKGMILLAPALTANVPHWSLVFLLQFTVGLCAAESEMPSAFASVNDNKNVWNDETTLKYIELDSKEGG